MPLPASVHYGAQHRIEWKGRSLGKKKDKLFKVTNPSQII